MIDLDEMISQGRTHIPSKKAGGVSNVAAGSSKGFKENVVEYMNQLKNRQSKDTKSNAEILAGIISTFGDNAQITANDITQLVTGNRPWVATLRKSIHH